MTPEAAFTLLTLIASNPGYCMLAVIITSVICAGRG